MTEPEVKLDVVSDVNEGNHEGTSDEYNNQCEDLGQQPTSLATRLMKDPQILAAMQEKLSNMVGNPSGYIQSLPKCVKRRIKALKKIQFEAAKIEAKFYKEVHKLECVYASEYASLYEKRSTVVNGNYEPNDDEADWPSDDEKDDEKSEESTEEVKNKASMQAEKDAEISEEKNEVTKGIPGFWLTIFKNVEMLSGMIQTHDEPILNHLQDIQIEFREADPMSFTLKFCFEPNEYFENKILTKEYILKSEPDEEDPFSFEGPEIVKCNGCKIEWKKGKNVTVKIVKKKHKHKATTKTVKTESFFNFFHPPSPPEDEEMDEDTEAFLTTDFEIGHFIRERIVPRAVLYFTGEALENEDDEYEDEEDEADYDEDADPDYVPTDGQPADCKQQ